MCGILAYIGTNPGFDLALDGLKMLLNRGYDSSGVCSINPYGKFVLHKYATSKTVSAVKLLEDHKEEHQLSNTIIMHTRWATHGAKTDANSHPHLDYKKRFAVVHNGIIENYKDLKKELEINHKIKFLSETDTEIIVNLISVYYDIYGDVDRAINDALNRLEGTWGLVIMCLDEPNKLYCSRHGSPLLIGFSEKYTIVASEQSGFCNNVNNYVCLNDNDTVVLERIEDLNSSIDSNRSVGNLNTHILFKKLHEYEIRKVTSQIGDLTPDPYPHWTVKEISEQHDSVMRAIGMGGRILNSSEVRLGGLNSHVADLTAVDNLVLLGCGTSYFAGLNSVPLLKKMSGFNSVQIFDGAEFTEHDIMKMGKTAILLLSQSGETKDLHRCIQIAKDHNLFMIGVVNVVDSMIAREVNCGVYLNAGKEVAVASTKVFTSQVTVLSMIAVWFAQKRGINTNMRCKIIEGLRRLPLDIKTTVESVGSICKQTASYLLSKHTLFILGKGRCESIAYEGALKIKEIGYINANGYSSSALRHGPFALLEEGTAIIMVVPIDDNFSKNINILSEVKSRGAYVIGISNSNLDKHDFDITLRVPYNEAFSGLLSVIPLQLIAYELAVMKGHNPDFPKNLAKTITVD